MGLVLVQLGHTEASLQPKESNKKWQRRNIFFSFHSLLSFFSSDEDEVDVDDLDAGDDLQAGTTIIEVTMSNSSSGSSVGRAS